MTGLIISISALIMCCGSLIWGQINANKRIDRLERAIKRPNGGSDANE